MSYIPLLLTFDCFEKRWYADQQAQRSKSLSDETPRKSHLAN